MEGIKMRLSQDAAIVLGLAATSMDFAHGREDEAERWLRVLRLHGRVGEALQALGVGEAPLMTDARPPRRRTAPVMNPNGSTCVDIVCKRSMRMAVARGADRVGTVDVLFAVLETYSGAFDKALYVRGASREELLVRLVSLAEVRR
jgi:hypothetical protein